MLPTMENKNEKCVVLVHTNSDSGSLKNEVVLNIEEENMHKLVGFNETTNVHYRQDKTLENKEFENCQLINPSTTILNMETFGIFSPISDEKYQSYCSEKSQREENGTETVEKVESIIFDSKGSSFTEQIKILEGNVETSTEPLRKTIDELREVKLPDFEFTERCMEFYETKSSSYNRKLKLEDLNKQINQIILNLGNHSKNVEDKAKVVNLNTDLRSPCEPIYQEKSYNQIDTVPESVYASSEKSASCDKKNVHDNSQTSKKFEVEECKICTIDDSSQNSGISIHGNVTPILDIEQYPWENVTTKENKHQNGQRKKKRRKGIEKNSNMAIKRETVEDILAAPKPIEKNKINSQANPGATGTPNQIECGTPEEIVNPTKIYTTKCVMLSPEENALNQVPSRRVIKRPNSQSKNRVTEFLLDIHSHFNLFCPFFGIFILFFLIGVMFYIGSIYTNKQVKRLH